jgi:flagellar biosynthesis/type III secretory pathway protein FliH
LVVIGAVATYALPKFNIALRNFSSFAELFPRETASAPISDPAVSATLKDIRSAQQQNAAALQEDGAVLQQNTAMLQQGAATLESLRQGFTTQQTNLKTISNQLSSLIARVDSLQNAVTPLTTSSITQPNARARLVRTSRKKTSRLLNKPVGPVSVGGAPLSPAPTPGSGAG